MPLGLALTAQGLRLTISTGMAGTIIVSPPVPPPPPPPMGIFLATELGEPVVTELGAQILLESAS